MVLYNPTFSTVATQFGMPLFGVQGAPGPFTGNYFWVDPVNGSDGNLGGPQAPLASLTQALTLAVAGNNDVIFLTNTYSPTATLAWNKNNTHLVGLDGEAALATGASINVASTAATSGAISPLVNVTATGCLFYNISVTSGINQAATQVCWAEAGGSNSYFNMYFNQVGNATAAAQAGNRALTVASTGNTFTNCVIGGDAVIRATGTNYSLQFLAGAGSSIFRGCVFPIYTSVAANLFVQAGSSTLTGYIIFDQCTFINDVNNASGTTMTVAMTAATASGGTIVLTPTTIVVGVTNVVASGGAVWFSSGASSAAAGNQAIIGT